MNEKENKVTNFMSPFAFTVNLDANALEVADKLRRNKFGAALVMDGDTLAGIITERDYLIHLHQLLKNNELPISELMTKDLSCIEGTETMQEAEKIMRENNIRHLPVINNGSVDGILSIKDVFNALQHLPCIHCGK